MANETLLNAIEKGNFEVIRSVASAQTHDDAALLMSIAKNMCYGGKHTDMRKAFQIFNACRNLLCQDYDMDVDLDMVCSWADKVYQTETGTFLFKT